MQNLASFQSIFDEVLFKLRAQGKSSTNSQDQCLYRGNNNTRCAVGHLILDKDYSPDMEGVTVEYVGNVTDDDIKNEVDSEQLARLLVAKALINNNCYDRERVLFLKELQSIHDGHQGFTRTEWLKSFNYHMKNLAEEYNLKYTE